AGLQPRADRGRRGARELEKGRSPEAFAVGDEEPEGRRDVVVEADAGTAALEDAVLRGGRAARADAVVADVVTDPVVPGARGDDQRIAIGEETAHEVERVLRVEAERVRGVVHA